MSEFRYLKVETHRQQNPIDKAVIIHHHIKNSDKEMIEVEKVYQLKRIADILDASIINQLEPYEGMLCVSVAGKK